MADSQVVKLTNLLLIAALKKGASRLRLYHDGARAVVDLVVDGETREELAPPAALHAAIVRRLSVMASLPVYKQGEFAEGTIHLDLGAGSRATFAIRVMGQGDDVEAWLRIV